MQITNFYSKSFLKGAFFVLLFLCGLNIFAGFSALALLPAPVHFALAGLFLVAALFILTKDFFVKYDSRDDFIEIERSRLFSNTKRPRKGAFSGYLKYRVRDYEVRERWYGSKLILKYEKLNGAVDAVHIPFTFFSKRHAYVLSRDLKRILNSDIHLFVGSGFKRPGSPAS